MEKSVAQRTLAAQVAALPHLSWKEIKVKWLEYFGEPPGVNNRRYAVRRLAHRLQEEAYRTNANPLIESNTKRIQRLVETGKVTRRAAAPAPTPGVVLTREHGGRLHRVTVLQDGGFDYDGRRYGSLSKIAREITGTRWSGPAFFGLRPQSTRKGERHER
ncbi:DUF2924 domain-containing protein [Lysobacter antibioticus]|uniref:DUF2924 domain-containing protein n=1 Tax=Lysobacter antibioticus TaxID=84531 RepID=A0A0S2FHJ8_LYSAN|nr:DUF2924 domain-containing protein [Lysobacter antibioticus]ALN83030.1 hypothetical protein LA76x_4928 [Lysobacter antibioticus]